MGASKAPAGQPATGAGRARKPQNNHQKAKKDLIDMLKIMGISKEKKKAGKLTPCSNIQKLQINNIILQPRQFRRNCLLAI